MFGLGKRAQLKKLSSELKGASLQEVVERFADVQFLKPPAIKFDNNIARIFSENISSEQQESAEMLLERLRAITLEHELEQGSHNIYLAQSTFEALRSYALDLTLATKSLRKEQAVKYLFDTWLKVPPEYYIIPIFFPAKMEAK